MVKAIFVSKVDLDAYQNNFPKRPHRQTKFWHHRGLRHGFELGHISTTVEVMKKMFEHKIVFH